MMRVLIVGLGSIARKHICAIRNIKPDTQILALRSGKTISNMDGVVNIYDLHDIDGEIDFALISNPTSCHADTIMRLKDLNIPLFIEKPIFESLGYDELVKEISRKGILTYVACNLRFLDSLRFLKDYISKHPRKRINEVNVYCGSYLPEWRPGTDYRKCYSAIPELGGGVHIDLIHEIDYIYWLFGKPLETRAICRSVSSLAIRAIDYANYSLIYRDFVVSIVLNYYRRDYKRTLEIVFEDGTWTLNLKANSIKDQNGVVIFKGEGDFIATYELQMRYFIKLLENKEKSENDIETAYNVLNICLNYE